MSYRIGIDFGTCFSFIAYVSENAGPAGINTLINPVNRMPYEIPSVFFHGEKENMRNLFGLDAVDHADSMRGNEDEDKYVVRYIKQQLFGKNDEWGSATGAADDSYVTKQVAGFELKGGDVLPKEIIRGFFAYFADLAREALHAEDHNELEANTSSKTPIEAVIAVPVVFSEQERSIIIEAAQEAGIIVIGIIEEPVAIAIDYIEHLNKKDELEPVLVYDLGGGTVDVACVKYHPLKVHDIEVMGGARVRIPGSESYEVIFSAGRRIGGVKWDEYLSEYILSRYSDEYKASPIPDPARPFHRRVTETKHILSKKDEINMPFTYIDPASSIPQNRDVLITRKTFEESTKDILDGTLECVRQVTSRCGLAIGSRLRVVLSGGSSRMPQVREGVLRILEQEVGVVVVNRASMLYRHEKAVALGATRYAKSLGNAAPNGVYGVALRNKRGFIQDEMFLIDRGQNLPAGPVEWTMYAPPSDEAEIVVIERYDKVPHYLAQVDRIMSIRFKFDAPLSKPHLIRGNLAMEKGGVIRLTAVHPQSGEAEVRFFSVNSFPHPRRVKTKGYAHS